MQGGAAIGSKVVMEAGELQALIDGLAAKEYAVYGPVVDEDSIAYDQLSQLSDLPIGKTDEQRAGRFHLVDRDDGAYFGFVHGSHSWKRFLHPPHEILWTAQKDQDGLEFTPPEPDDRKLAFIGVRSCDINAIAIQDRVLRDGPFADTGYRQRRDGALFIAVNCIEPGGTCFCTSMGTGPKCESGFDLALTELLDNERHDFLVEVGTADGAAILASVDHRPADPEDIDCAERLVAGASRRMGRTLDTHDLKEMLQQNLQHPRWDAVAERCLTCGNCTMVCPTCFCTNVTDQTTIDGAGAVRSRTWDTCFSLDFSYIHGGSVRSSTSSRYRQWMTHKLSYWFDQFGTSGCVGCGRCITWCPVGIDITEEAAAIRATRQDQ